MIFDIDKAKRHNLPQPLIVLMESLMENMNHNLAVLEACEGPHEFDFQEIRDACKKAGPAGFTSAKCKCKKCGGEVYALYAGGYRDAVKDMRAFAEGDGA